MPELCLLSSAETKGYNLLLLLLLLSPGFIGPLGLKKKNPLNLQYSQGGRPLFAESLPRIDGMV